MDPDTIDFFQDASVVADPYPYLRALRERSILVRWFDQDRIRDHVRITIGTAEQMRALIQVTADLLDHGVAAAFPPWHTCKNT